MAIDPNKTIKILCVCQKGCCRSLGTMYRLNRRGYGNVIAVGCETAAPETLRMLCEWADTILLASPDMIERLPIGAVGSKIDQRFAIGRDLWGLYRHPDLQRIIRTQLNAISLR